MDYKDFDPELARDLQVIPTPVVAKKKKKLGGWLALYLCCAIVGTTFGIGVGGSILYYRYHVEPGGTPQIYYASPPLEASKVVTYSSSDVALPDLYTMNVDATVGITVSTTSVNYFGQPTSSAAAGSGFVISENGYIVTNHHVIEEAIDSDNPIEVKFKNGQSFNATIVGYEADNDLAVLKINVTGLQAVVLGDSDQLVVGETVVAIGNPLGELDFTFTNGIISAKDRLISTGDGYTMNMLQTNTAINPGNSGGPLFDGQGALIGINTAKYAESSSGITVEGLGFAIPINDVKEMILDIIAHGYVTGKPYLGVTVANYLTDGVTVVDTGAVVHHVATGSAAEKAGVQINDIITAIGDVAVDSVSALTAAMNEYRAGDTAVFSVLRNGQTVKLTLIFDEKNEGTVSNNELTVVEPEPEIETEPETNSRPSRGDSPAGNSGSAENSTGELEEYFSEFEQFFDSFFGSKIP